MSHFSTIKTQLKEAEPLIKALNHFGYIINQGLIAESLALGLSRKLRNYDLIVELDLSGASFSKQFKKANKLKSKSIIIIGDDEATKREFIIIR